MDIVFKTKPEIALDQIKAAHAAGAPQGVVLADAGYGTDTRFRTGVTALGLGSVLGERRFPLRTAQLQQTQSACPSRK